MANGKHWTALSIILGAVASIVVATVTVSALSQEDAPPQDVAQVQGAFGTGFTYQGRLDRSGEPVDDDCQMAFRLYDQAAGSSQVGATISATVPISDGLFTIKLDFGSGVFAGDTRWLGIQVLCPGDSVYADLGRQELTASPYALYAASTGALQGNPVTATVPAAGQVLEWDGSAWGPGADDDTTYTAGAGLDLDGTTFSITPTYRLPQSCAGGQIAEWNGSTWQCGADDDTTYTAGTGLDLGGGAFSITPTYQLPQSCAGGQIAEWNGSTWQCGSDDVGAGGIAWSLTGNSGTTPGTHFLGTTDGVNLTLAVSGTAALRLEPRETTPNLIGGYEGNSAGLGVAGVTIGGGGASGYINQVTGNQGTVGGGWGNTAGENWATVGGGNSNSAAGNSATVAGGQGNTAGGNWATIGGGMDNIAGGWATVGGGYNNTASYGNATIGGGYNNTAGGGNATVGGGQDNTASDAWVTIGGGQDNTASSTYATVGGGEHISVTGEAATVAGGSHITVTGDYAAVGGGQKNTASGWAATIGGGESNTVGDDYATVGGGQGNTAGGGGMGNTAGYYATVGGGQNNTAVYTYTTIGGGGGNTALGDAATIGGGNWNTAGDMYATVGGGESNDAFGEHATVGGGRDNTAFGDYATVGGGYGNADGGVAATIGGGIDNTASSSGATVGGGSGNTASGVAATVPGGGYSTASGDYSFAAGYDANATHSRSFVWSGAGTYSTSSWGDYTFTARSHGGARFYSASGTGTGVQLSSGGTAWGSISDRNAKENFATVDAARVLETLAEMPVQTWNLRSQSPEMRHIGPVAQDFNGQFGYLFGEVESPVHINNMDAIGVSLAAIQGLYAQNQALEAEVASYKEENTAQQEQIDALQQQNTDLEARVAALETASLNGPAPSQAWQANPLPWTAVFLAAALLAWALRRREGLIPLDGGGR